jgi:hypothetical protein
MSEQNQNPAAVVIPIEVSYLPVQVGDVRMKFRNTNEHFIELNEMAKDPDAYIKQKASDLLPEFDRFSEKVDKLEKQGKKPTFDDLKEIMALQKEAFSRTMDDIFTPGDFDRLYAAYPDLLQLIAIIPTIAEVVAEAAGRSIELREEDYNRKAKSILKKKNKKKRPNDHKRKK